MSAEAAIQTLSYELDKDRHEFEVRHFIGKFGRGSAIRVTGNLCWCWKPVNHQVHFTARRILDSKATDDN